MIIPPAYPGLQKVGPDITTNEMTTHGQGLGMPPQPVVATPQQTESHQLAMRPVTAELETNPQVTGMPPELPASTGFVA